MKPIRLPVNCNAFLPTVGTNMLSVPIFPVEIFELCIDQVDRQDDRRDRRAELSTLALVCRAFGELCQPRLFSSITVATRSCPKHICDAFERQIEFLKTKPTFLSYVHELRTWGPWVTGIPASSRVVGDESTQMILLDLPRLKKLSIEAYASYSTSDSQTFGFRRLLDQYISTTQLTTLDISQMTNLPILRILSCPGLLELKLYNCGLSPCWRQANGAQVSDPRSRGFKLKRLDVFSEFHRGTHCLHPLLVHCDDLQDIKVSAGRSLSEPSQNPFVPENIQSTPYLGFREVKSVESENDVDWTYFCALAKSCDIRAFPKLTSLTLVLRDASDIFNSANVIFEHLQVLESLSLTLSFEENETSRHLDLSTCFINSRDTLKSISLDWERATSDPQSPEPTTTILSALKAAPRNNVIESIHLRTATDASEVYSAEFSKLAELLIDESEVLLPRLRSVEVTFTTLGQDPYGSLRDDEFRAVCSIVPDPFKRAKLVSESPNLDEDLNTDEWFRCQVWIEGLPYPEEYMEFI